MEEKELNTPETEVIKEKEREVIDRAETEISGEMGVDVPLSPEDTEVPLDKNVRLM